jgi:hypothetical protein
MKEQKCFQSSYGQSWFQMTLQQLKEIALKATQIEFQTHHDNSTVSVKWCSPEMRRNESVQMQALRRLV